MRHGDVLGCGRWTRGVRFEEGRVEYYERFFRPLASHVFDENEVLVQIDGDLPQDEANGYDDVLEEVEV